MWIYKKVKIEKTNIELFYSKAAIIINVYIFILVENNSNCFVILVLMLYINEFFLFTERM